MFNTTKQQALFDFLGEEDGTTAVEYAVMVALIIGVCMASIQFLTDQTRDSFNDSAAAISGSWGN